MSTIAVLTHIYYEESYSKLKEYYLNFDISSCFLFFSVNLNQNTKSLVNKIKKDFPHSYILETPNIGKDIGGKLALIDLCLAMNLNIDYYILLHDKKSPHTSLGDTWREKLFRIIEKENISKIQALFKQNKKIGIVAAREFISNEYNLNTGDFNCTSNDILKKLIVHHKLNISNYDFVGGTMFWVRAQIVNNFFKTNRPLEIRSTLEKGNVLDHIHGSKSHSWERLLSYIANDQGFKIIGI